MLVSLTVHILPSFSHLEKYPSLLLAVASASLALPTAFWPFRLQLQWHSLDHREALAVFTRLLLLPSHKTNDIIYLQCCFTSFIHCSPCDMSSFGLRTCLFHFFTSYNTDSRQAWLSLVHYCLTKVAQTHSGWMNESKSVDFNFLKTSPLPNQRIDAQRVSSPQQTPRK